MKGYRGFASRKAYRAHYSDPKNYADEIPAMKAYSEEIDAEETGRQRMETIRHHVQGVANARLQQFMAGTLSIMPCWGDELDDLIARELDQCRGPVQLGLWFWKT
jgi:hypothetical protein